MGACSWLLFVRICVVGFPPLLSSLRFPSLSLCLRVCKLLRIDGSASHDGLLHSSFLLHERGHYMKARTQRRLFAAWESMNMFILFYLLAYDVFPNSFFVLRVCVCACVCMRLPAMTLIGFFVPSRSCLRWLCAMPNVERRLFFFCPCLVASHCCVWQLSPTVPSPSLCLSPLFSALLLLPPFCFSMALFC